jgi:hypothetical protein
MYTSFATPKKQEFAILYFSTISISVLKDKESPIRKIIITELNGPIPN